MSWSPETVHTFWCDAQDCDESWWGAITLASSIIEQRQLAARKGWTSSTSARSHSGVDAGYSARDYCPEHSKGGQPS